MAYAAEISRLNPTCFVVLMDQSGSMADPFGGGEGLLRKADFLADVVNRTLQDLVLRCAKAEEIRDYFHVAMLGYGGSVGSAFSGALAGRGMVPISEVGEQPARLDNRTKKVPDGAGGLAEQVVRFPIWVEPASGGATPMCAALREAHGLLSQWLSSHPNCFPPVVLHITDGEATDGDPRDAGHALTELRSSDGSILVYNAHLSSDKAPKIEYPSSAESLANDFARTLFEISSVLPAEFQRAASELGRSLNEGARGFVFNADAVSLVQFFDIGTRPVNLR
ncbi:MAG: VWA domain-containing protein [Chloroflexi bacterium]|nr:VWA domain-containing protein [Chloroflexota bacterium]